MARGAQAISAVVLFAVRSVGQRWRLLLAGGPLELPARGRERQLQPQRQFQIGRAMGVEPMAAGLRGGVA